MKQQFTFKTLYDLIKKEKRDLLTILLYGLGATLLLLPIPMFVPLLIDEILLHHPGEMTKILSLVTGSSEIWQQSLAILLIMLLLRVSAYLMVNQKSYYAERITQKIAYLLRHRILQHLQRLSLKAYETLQPGGIASKTVQDVESVSGFAGQTASTFFSALLMLLGIAAVMLWMHWVLALLVFTLNPFFFLFAKRLGQKTGRLLRKKHEAYQNYHELLNETLELFVQIRASNRENHFFDRLGTRAQHIESTALEHGHKALRAQNSSLLLTNVVVDIFRVIGILAVAYSDLSLGMMIAFLFYLSTMVGPMQQLMALATAYKNVKPALERIDHLLTLEQEPDHQGETDPFAGKTSTSVALEAVHFGYPGGKKVLHGVSIHARPGETIALVGASGSGKTTIAQLLVGFYAPDSGKIKYDGVPVEEMGFSTVRENVALMLQDTLLFNDTLRMNLTLFDEKRDEEIYAALHAAQLDEFIGGLEEGLETSVGKNGIRLSGGQRQRLAIARLVLSDPKVVILDESTSSLDMLTEHRLYETLSVFLKERTTVIIAHRTTTIKQAERIYVIEKGRVKAEGSYDTLQAQGLLLEDFDV